MSDRRLASTITVGGATNAGTFEAAELMAAGMSAREVAWPRLVVDEAPLTASDIDDFVECQRRVDPAMLTLTVKSGQKVRSVFLRCMRDVGFIDEAGVALPIVVPVGVARLVNAAPRPWGWPMRESFPVAQFQFDVLD